MFEPTVVIAPPVPVKRHFSFYLYIIDDVDRGAAADSREIGAGVAQLKIFGKRAHFTVVLSPSLWNKTHAGDYDDKSDAFHYCSSPHD
jgi:hypothetical protein